MIKNDSKKMLFDIWYMVYGNSKEQVNIVEKVREYVWLLYTGVGSVRRKVRKVNYRRKTNKSKW